MTLGQDPQLWPCPRCQTPIPSTSAFCPRCGLELAQAPAPPQAQGDGVQPLTGWRAWSTKKKAVVAGAIVLVGLLVLGSVVGRPATPPGVGLSPTLTPAAATAGPTQRAAAVTAQPAPPATLPASTRPPAPPPGGIGRIGEKIQLGGYQYVTLTDAEFSSTGYGEFFEPDPGNYIYAVLVEFEGIDPSGSSYNPFYFKAVVDGFEYNFSAFGKEPALQSGELRTGQTVRGWMSFEAPVADLVTVVYDPVFGLEGDPIEWTFNVND